ncbi:acyltransferase family protein [Microbacterium terrisoli]|uniref:acyltransferase family protein n=1 Tax=Microbacterium terrisoli TaxID=3242192 RepID=UPI00280584E8|nr:acyltransferase [Microbacterium protaetiae]
MPVATRLSALDGLRGIAALVVVVHHALLVSPSFAAAYYGGPTPDNPWLIALAYTPLHLMWGGAEAVVLFFVLSGFVLSRAARSRSFDWFAYFPSRILRLYVPVIAAVAFAFAILLLPHDGATSSPWLTGRVTGYPLHDILRDLTLLGGSSGVVSPLWTLRWEVIFSLLLPVAAYFARLIPAWMLGIACVVMSAIGASQDVASLQYLPIFGIGVALEGMWDGISRMVERATRHVGWLVWTAVLAVATVLLSMHWLLLLPLGHSAAVAFSQAPIVIGAAIFVVAAVHCAPLRRALTWRPVVLLGAISFSLYLIHEPIVIFMANLTDAMTWTLLTAVPLALITAWVFWLVVERPAHHLARFVRTRATQTDDPAQTTQADDPAPMPSPGAGAEAEHRNYRAARV